MSEKSLFEASDILGLREPLVRLIEVVARGIGSVTRPMLIRRLADSRAYEMRCISSAIAQCQKIAGEIRYVDGVLSIASEEDISEERVREIEGSISKRINYREQRRQVNIENIILEASEDLEEAGDVPEERPSDDWATRFFRIAEDVSEHELRKLWGRVLSGEIQRPGSYSLRTLEVLRNISLQEAETFGRVARFAMHGGKFVFLPNLAGGKFLSEEFSVELTDFILLREIGLLGEANLSMKLGPTTETAESTFICGLTFISILTPANTSGIDCPAVFFTEIGKQLLRLIPYEKANDAFIRKFGAIFQKPGVVVKVGDTTGPGDGGISVSYNVRDLPGNLPLENQE